MSLVYDCDGITLYHGDAREIVPTLAPVDAVVTDPPWPGAAPTRDWTDDPEGLFGEVAVHFPHLVGDEGRVVIILGCDTSPAMLARMPGALPFVRLCWLRFAIPGFRGTILRSADVAYVYGGRWVAVPGNTLMPGECTVTTTAAGRRETQRIFHPTPRRLEHVQWVVHQFTRPGSVIVDPFIGSGTTALACRLLGRRCIGIDMHWPYLEHAIERLERQPLLPMEELA